MSSDEQSCVMCSASSEVWPGGMQCLLHISCITWARGACMCNNTVCCKLLMCTEQPGFTAAADQARQGEGGSVHTTVLACHAIREISIQLISVMPYQQHENACCR